MFLILIVAAAWAFDYGLDRWLNRTLPEILNRNPDRLYQIEYQQLEVDWFQRQLTLKELSIKKMKINPFWNISNYIGPSLQGHRIEKELDPQISGVEFLFT